MANKRRKSPPKDKILPGAKKNGPEKAAENISASEPTADHPSKIADSQGKTGEGVAAEAAPTEDLAKSKTTKPDSRKDKKVTPRPAQTKEPDSTGEAASGAGAPTTAESAKAEPSKEESDTAAKTQPAPEEKTTAHAEQKPAAEPAAAKAAKGEEEKPPDEHEQASAAISQSIEEGKVCWNQLEEEWNKAKDFIVDALPEKIKEAWNQGKDALEKANEILDEDCGKIWEEVKQAWDELMSPFDEATEIWDQAKEKWEKAKQRIKELDETAGESAREAYKNAKEAYEKGKEAYENGKEAITKAKEAIDDIKQTWSSAVGSWESAVQSLKEGNLNRLKEAWQQAQEAAKNAQEAWKKAKDAYADAKEAWDLIKEALQKAQEALEKAKEAYEYFKALLEEGEEEKKDEEEDEKEGAGESEECEIAQEYYVAPNLTNTVVISGLSAGGGDIKVVEVADIQFRTDSAVPAPLCETEGQTAPIPALAAIRVAYLFGEKNPDWQLLITGHADTRGRPQYNSELTAHRAKTILALMTGDQRMWTGSCIVKHTNEDIQAILKFVHGYEGLDCDPGDIDGNIGPRTTAAIRKFQAGFNRLYEERIEVDGIWGEQSWGAAFRFYRRFLERSLGPGRRELDSYSRGLNFYRSRQICACGESIPIDHPGADSYNSQTNRRVEILFLAPDLQIEFTCCSADGPYPQQACELNSCPLYGVPDGEEQGHTFENINPEDLIERQTIKIRLRDSFGKPLADAGYILKSSVGNRNGRSDGSGIILESDLPEGEVRIALEDGSLLDFAPEEAFDGEHTFGGEELPSSGGISSASETSGGQEVSSDEAPQQKAFSGEEEEELQT